MPNTQTQPAVITKTIGVPLEKSVEKTDKSTILVRGFFTSDAPDMHGDIITRAATEGAIGLYRQWGNIRRMHKPEPVGKVRRIGVDDGLEWNEVEIEVIDPKAIFEVENDLLQALSIGALIKWDDITWLEDGGMLISAYLLGEISLVDHPANYDSYLTDENSAQSAVQMLVKRYGLDVVSKGMLEILKEKDMTDELEKDVTIEDETIEEAPETNEDITEEKDVETTTEITEEVEETTDDVEEDVVVENDIDEELEEEVIEDGADEIVEDDETTEEVELSVDEDIDPISERLTAIETQIGAMHDLLKSMATVDTEEAIEEDVEEEPIEEVQKDINDTDEEETEVVVEQKTVIPSDEIETEETEEVEKDASSALHKALQSRFNR